MDDQDSGRPSRRKQFRELLFRRKGKSSARGNQGSTSKSDEPHEGPAAPLTQMAEIEGERIRRDLWGAAYEQVQKEDPKLLVAYKKYLLVPKTERDQGTSSDNTFYLANITIVAAGCYKPEGRLPYLPKINGYRSAGPLVYYLRLR
jgi:hypothetical protein